MELSKQDKEYWDTKEAFNNQMANYVEEFRLELTGQKLSAGAINGYIRVATAFVNHIKGYTEHIRFEDISVPNANSKFLAHVKWEGLSDWNPKEIKVKLKAFIEFLDNNGFRNERVLDSFQN